MRFRSMQISPRPPVRVRRAVPERFRLFDWLMHTGEREVRGLDAADARRPRAGDLAPPGSAMRRWNDDEPGRPGFQFRGIL